MEQMHRYLWTDAQNRCADEASKHVIADGSAKGKDSSVGGPNG